MQKLNTLPGAATAPVPVTASRPGGISLPVDARAFLRSATAARRFSRQLLDLVLRNYRVALSIDGLGNGSAAAARFAALCATLARDFAEAGIRPAPLELSVRTSSLSPGAALRVCRHELGTEVLNIIVDDGSLADSRTCLALWRLRAHNNVRVAFWPMVTSDCPLLSAEPALAVLPGTGLQVPEQSAWVVSSVDVAAAQREAGEAMTAFLEEQVTALVHAADDLHDRISWPTPAMCHDSWLNRRIAIDIEGIGNAARQLDLDPAHNKTRRVVIAWLDCIRSAAQKASAGIARSAGTLPAITAGSPCHRIAGDSLRRAWERRWLKAVSRVGVRHRNLLTLSPWSLFPSGDADPAFSELMPVLSLADAMRFQRRQSIAKWNINDFRRFHERAAAVLTAARRDCVVAERL